MPWIIANGLFITYLIISLFMRPTKWPPENDDLDKENNLFPIINTIWLTLIVTEIYPIGFLHPFPSEEEEYQLQELH